MPPRKPKSCTTLRLVCSRTCRPCGHDRAYHVFYRCQICEAERRPNARHDFACTLHLDKKDEA